jgi:uncharacterized protein (TIGR00304 family)
MPDWSFLVTGGYLMIILGFLLVFISILRSVIVHKTEENPEKEVTVKGGCVVFIGPIPVVFGSDMHSVKILMLLAIVLTLLLIILNK